MKGLLSVEKFRRKNDQIYSPSLFELRSLSSAGLIVVLRRDHFCEMALYIAWLSMVGTSDLQLPFPKQRSSFLIRHFGSKTNGNVLQDLQQYGDAPIRQAPAGLDKQRYAESDPPPSHTHHHHRLHFPGHRHTRSKE